MTHVLSVGIAVLDCIFELETIPASAEKHIANDARWVVGGCATNAAVAMARLGGQVSLAAELGDDIAGDIILNNLNREGIDLSKVFRHPNARSSVSSIFIDARGERQIVNFRGDTGDNSRTSQGHARACEFERTAFTQLQAVLADTRWLAGAEAALLLAREMNIPGVLDAEAPIPEALLHKASHIAFSRTGLLSLSPASNLQEALLSTAKTLTAWICVTDGANGVYTVLNDRIHHHPAYRVTTVDTLGAGDVWHGAFCLKLAQGVSEVDSIEFANAAAALKCSQPGGGDAAPNLSKVEAFILQQKNTGRKTSAD